MSLVFLDGTCIPDSTRECWDARVGQQVPIEPDKAILSIDWGPASFVLLHYAVHDFSPRRSTCSLIFAWRDALRLRTKTISTLLFSWDDPTREAGHRAADKYQARILLPWSRGGAAKYIGTIGGEPVGSYKDMLSAWKSASDAAGLAAYELAKTSLLAQIADGKE